jgi:hypothetical protein
VRREEQQHALEIVTCGVETLQGLTRSRRRDLAVTVLDSRHARTEMHADSCEPGRRSLKQQAATSTDGGCFEIPQDSGGRCEIGQPRTRLGQIADTVGVECLANSKAGHEPKAERDTFS